MTITNFNTSNQTFRKLVGNGMSTMSLPSNGIIPGRNKNGMICGRTSLPCKTPTVNLVTTWGSLFCNLEMSGTSTSSMVSSG